MIREKGKTQAKCKRFCKMYILAPVLLLLTTWAWERSDHSYGSVREKEKFPAAIFIGKLLRE